MPALPLAGLWFMRIILGIVDLLKNRISETCYIIIFNDITVSVNNVHIFNL